MARRHSNALLIQEGAVNPSAIALTIADACDEIRREPTYRGTDSIREDAAVRLMVHQLAFLCRVPAVDNEPMLYSLLIKECEAKR